jgi:hypothetical protein
MEHKVGYMRCKHEILTSFSSLASRRPGHTNSARRVGPHVWHEANALRRRLLGAHWQKQWRNACFVHVNSSARHSDFRTMPMPRTRLSALVFFHIFVQPVVPVFPVLLEILDDLRLSALGPIRNLDLRGAHDKLDVKLLSAPVCRYPRKLRTTSEQTIQAPRPAQGRTRGDRCRSSRSGSCSTRRSSNFDHPALLTKASSDGAIGMTHTKTTSNSGPR